MFKEVALVRFRSLSVC